MKHIKLFILLTLLCPPVIAQNFEGVYTGALFSERNAVTMRATGSLVAGTVLINRQDKFIFFGEIKGSELTGTMDYAAKAWAFKGALIGDSLLISMTSGKETKQALLKKISSNPSKNTSKLLDPATRDAASGDEKLIGEWALKRIENPDGSPKAIDEKIRGAVYKIYSDGSYYVHIPYISRNSNFSPPKSKWSTNGSKLTTTNDFKSNTVEYEIRGDTLILKPNMETTYWVKRK
ncbi:MAG: lipocalin family protein [Cyclobacteriaceae bacterium]|nr:lipocalin family protein [Cyclobacteriaceae bacterium]